MSPIWKTAKSENLTKMDFCVIINKFLISKSHHQHGGWLVVWSWQKDVKVLNEFWSCQMSTKNTLIRTYLISSALISIKRRSWCEIFCQIEQCALDSVIQHCGRLGVWSWRRDVKVYHLLLLGCEWGSSRPPSQATWLKQFSAYVRGFAKITTPVILLFF